MQQFEGSFSNHFKYTYKNEDKAFSIKYVIEEQKARRKVSQYFQNKHSNVENVPQQLKRKQKFHEKKMFQQQQFPSLKKLRSRSSEFKQMPSKNNKKLKPLFSQHISIQEITESRQKNQKIYYQGKAEFRDHMKWSCRILSNELDGYLIAEEENCNRAIHDDQLYFKIIRDTSSRTICKIVAIVPSKRTIIGRVSYFPQKNIYILQPINARITSFNVPLNKLPLQCKKSITTNYFIAGDIIWDIYSKYPECQIIQQFGVFGQIQTQTTALLHTYGIATHQYTEDEVKQALKDHLQHLIHDQFIIPQKQIETRTDLRSSRVFTIDPLTARDFDDALSIEKINDQTFEVGVHIADASYFVPEGGILDRYASQSTTSVYLVHKVLPMLPRLLCDSLCSLVPAKPRLTLSVWFSVTADGKVGNVTRFNRSVICSKARFTYEQAQEIIQNKINKLSIFETGFGCTNQEDFQQIAKDILLMNKLAVIIRDNRLKGGALTFQTPKKIFKLDEKGFPLSFENQSRVQAHCLVQQFMLLANQKVAQILVKQHSQAALLRRHRFPGDKKISRFQQFMKKIERPMKFDKGTKLQQHINLVANDKSLKNCIKQLVRHQTLNVLQAAEYFIIGENAPQTWRHYALNMATYTHFTSPIRRYPDILVHRQLIAILEKKKLPPGYFTKIVATCNSNKMKAKRVSSGCDKIFLCLYLRDHPIRTQAFVTNVDARAIYLCVTGFDIRYTIQIKELLSLVNQGVDAREKKFIKVVYSKKGVNMRFILREMQQIQVQLKATKTFPVNYDIKMVFPHPELQKETLLIQ